MNKSKLTSFQFSCLIYFPILSLFSGIGTYNTIKTAGIDAYLAIPIAYLIGFLLITLFFLIFNYQPNLNITQKTKLLFGKNLGIIINILINLCLLFIGIILLYNISNFAISQFLSATPILIFMLVIGSIIFYNVSLGIENISRVAILFLGIICILTLISTSGILPNFETSNIKPFLEYGIQKPFLGGIILCLTNIVPIFMLLIIEKKKITNQTKITKHVIFFYTLAFLFAFLAIFLTLGALGIHLSKLYQYPEYTVLKKISLFNFIERIENFIYTKWILNSVICLSLITYHISKSIHPKSTKIIPLTITILIIILSNMIFKNNTIFYNMSFKILPYICLLLLIIYLIIGLNIFIRKVLKIETN